VFSTSDTIVAIATPPGRGGIGVVRISGPDAHQIAQRITVRDQPFEPRYATLTCVAAGSPSDVVSGSSDVASGLSSDAASGSSSGVASGFSRTRSIDQAIVTFFQSPASYTGDDVIEIAAHGSPMILKLIVEAAIAHGARLAAPGEFTLRAYLNGRIDLPQAEAVADLIDAATPLQASTAFDQLNGTLTARIAAIESSLFDLVAQLEASVDFPEEGYHFVEPGQAADAIDALAAQTACLLRDAKRGRLIREGLQIAIVGPPNVGKSSLFNALAGASRAIVTDVAGTTRDLITEAVDIDGVRVTLVDTAGLREAADPIEAEGVFRARAAIDAADLLLLVADRSERDGLSAATAHFSRRPETTPVIIVGSKADLPAAWSNANVVYVSSTTGIGLGQLRNAIFKALNAERTQTDRPEITNLRHIALVERAHDAMLRARSAASGDDGRSMSEEFVLADLQEARHALEEITGARTPDDVLARIFERFCVGK
jgi:tRNA modification GTPase